MSSSGSVHGQAAKHGKTRHVNMLWRKLYRDYAHNLGQCLLILLMCALGTWVFSGLDGTWRVLDNTAGVYYRETALADMWIRGAGFSREDILNVRRLDSVEDAQPRVTAEFFVKGLGDDRKLVTHTVDEDSRICIPTVKEGSMIRPNDVRGCMLDERFAHANGLKVGDRLVLDIYGRDVAFSIRALIAASEHMYISRYVQSEPLHYSFVYISRSAVPELPDNEILVRLKPGANIDETETQLDGMLLSATVIDRKANQSTKNVANNTETYQNMLKIFPAFFNLAVILFIVSTMARVIGSQRVEIGTMFGLGLSTARIALHYIFYTGIPALLGAVIGLVSGSRSLPEIMWNIHQRNCNYPDKIYPDISLYAWLVTGLVVLANVGICCFVLHRIAVEAKASLLRPQTAAKGNHVLLEKWRGLWSRISWSGKTVVRNLMRRKFRTVVTLIGVFFCNALLLCSMGLSDSVEYFVGRYFYGTLQYDIEAEMTGEKTLEYYRSRLDAGTVDGMMIKQVTACSDTEKRIVDLCVMADDQTTMYLGENTEYLPLPERGAAVSKKIAEILGLKKGDTVSLWLPGDDRELALTIKEFADNDINPGIYIGRRQWESFRRGAFIPSMLQIRKPSAQAMQFLRESDDVGTLRRLDVDYEDTLSFLGNLRGLFTVLQISALGFGLVVCYSMGITSFIERRREYAVQRVLGCRWGVIIRQILTENGLVAIPGVLLGIFPGILIMRLMLKLSENENTVFRPFVSWQSVVLASVISFLFSLLIALVIAVKLRKLNLVEEIKSVE